MSDFEIQTSWFKAKGKQQEITTEMRAVKYTGISIMNLSKEKGKKIVYTMLTFFFSTYFSNFVLGTGDNKFSIE